MEKEFILENTQDVQKVAEYLMEIILKNKSFDKAGIVLLSGDLGVGKTTLVQAIGKIVFVTSIITSPTFMIMKSHKIQNTKIPFVNLVHIDAYRIADDKEMHILRLGEVFQNKDNLVFVEWPENLKLYDFGGAINVTFEHLGDTKRKVIIRS